MEAKNGDAALIYVVSVILLLLTGWIYWDYYRPPWKQYQSGFRSLVVRRFGEGRARQVPAGIQQIWVERLNRVDRCVTCHLGIEWEGLEDVPNPYRSHPQGILKKHSVSRYGCTICHGGQGYALGVESAHATSAENWDEPLLYTELGKSFQIDPPRALIQINCNLCHRYDSQTEGADYINLAKQLVQEKRCVMCHEMNESEKGGTLGPELQHVGDQAPEHFDYSHLPGKQTAFGWHLAHFKDPKSMTPGTMMPNFNFGSRETQALAMLMMSWRRMSLPTDYFPAPKMAQPLTPQKELSAPASQASPEGKKEKIAKASPAEMAESGKKEEAKGDSAKGKEVFETYCKLCHNPDSEERKIGPGLKGLFSKPPHKMADGTEHKHTVEMVREQIVKGSGAMPPIGASFPPQQLDDLIAYLQTL